MAANAHDAVNATKTKEDIKANADVPASHSKTPDKSPGVSKQQRKATPEEYMISATKHGDFEEVKALYDKVNKDIFTLPDLKNPIAVAILYGHIAILDFFAAKGHKILLEKFEDKASKVDDIFKLSVCRPEKPIAMCLHLLTLKKKEIEKNLTLGERQVFAEFSITLDNVVTSVRFRSSEHEFITAITKRTQALFPNLAERIQAWISDGTRKQNQFIFRKANSGKGMGDYYCSSDDIEVGAGTNSTKDDQKKSRP